ncbi:bifunctional biotin--[acetyl-CoA-carboxylase] ligase/biotin operon repressor BirA [Pseudomonas sp. Marseille-QA0892]
MYELIALLSDGKFHSGNELGRRLALTRAGIWKRLQHVKDQHGLDILAVPGKGYKLSQPICLLDQARLTATQTAWPLDTIDSIDSTNAEVLRRLNQGAKPPFALVAEQQFSGRGRRGRAWVSPFGENIYYSLAAELTGGSSRLDGLSLTVGVAVAETLISIGVTDIGLKWPNDVLLAGRKVAGVLIELHGDPMDVCTAIIGVGVNVNMQATEAVDQPWTSLRLQAGRLWDRTAIAMKLTDTLGACLAEHYEQGFSGALKSRWEVLHAWRDQPVSLISGAHIQNGVARRVDERGALLIEVDGVERAFSGGELSLRLMT